MDTLHRALRRALAPLVPAAGPRLLLACSGGPDSLALVLAAAELAPGQGWELHVAHVDHGLRPGAADEAAHVAAQVAPLPLHRLAVDVPATMAATDLGPETAARSLRLAALARLAGELGAGIVLTGHHADDQLETVLMRLVHGTHGGLRGIPAVRSLAPGVLLVHPWLELGRAELAAFVAARGGVPLVDGSNMDEAIERNRLRHRVVPVLRALNPALDQTLARSLAQRGVDEDYLARAAAAALRPLVALELPGVLRLPHAALHAMPAALRGRALALAAARVGLRGRARSAARLMRLAELVDAGAGAVELGAGVHARIQGPWLWLRGPVGLVPARAVPEAAPGDWGLVLAMGPYPSEAPSFDPAAWTPAWVWRPGTPDDMFHPWGRPRPVPLMRWLQKARVPERWRSSWPVLASGAEILWVAGLGRGNGAPVPPGARHALQARNHQRPWFDKVWSGPYHDETMLGGCDPIE